MINYYYVRCILFFLLYIASTYLSYWERSAVATCQFY